MDKEEIKKILPHREPMLLVDEVTIDGTISTGKYTVKGDEFFLQGHFPNNPVVPGVILCEMMAQSACLLLGLEQTNKNFTPYFTGLDNVKFRKPVTVGDEVVFTCELVKSKGMFHKIKGAGHVGGVLCVSGELSVAVVE